MEYLSESSNADRTKEHLSLWLVYVVPKKSSVSNFFGCVLKKV